MIILEVAFVLESHGSEGIDDGAATASENASDKDYLNLQK